MASEPDYEDMGLTTKQKDILHKFRSNLQDILTPHHTDPEILRWLRGNNYEFKRAEKIFRATDACRKMCRFDAIMETFILPEVFKKYVRSQFLGFAKDGSAIRYYHAHMDFVGTVHSMSLYHVLFLSIYLLEQDFNALKEQTEKTGRKHSKITFILDFDGFCYSNVFHSEVINCGLDMFGKFQEFYPELWSKFLLINAPYLMDKVIMLFKPAFRNNFIDSFHIANKSSTSALLKKYIDEDELPVLLGGSKVDPNFKEHSYRKVPEKYYLRNVMHLINEEDPGVKKQCISYWSVFNVPLIVKEPGRKIRIELRSEGGSIYLTIFHRTFTTDSEDFKLPESNETLNDTNSNLRTVLPRLKPYTEVSPMDFMIYAEWPGAYIFYFENGSNLFSSIKLYYRFTLLPPTS